ncbi:MAG TPA: hypothetical protein VK046_03445 [Actinomycetaceae bacterium]|nr:hypothetical protein [Actinomycetaceae bacterium]
MGHGGVGAAAGELRRLLLDVPEYRSRWLQHVQRRRGSGLSHSAVARALSSVDSSGASLESLRDRSRRALNGEVLTASTLRLFGEAFDFTVAEQDRLWVLLGREAEPVERFGAVARAAYGGEPEVATLSRAVDLRVGADRTSWTVRSTLTVQALVDGVQRFPLVQSRRDVRLVPVLGCQVEHGTADGREELIAHYAVFPRALAAGEIHVYGYDTCYTARSDHRDRYVVGVATPTAVLAVQVGFTPPQLPARLHWRTWRTLELADEDVLTDQEVLLGPSHRASWTQQDVRAGIGGFEWTWPD